MTKLVLVLSENWTLTPPRDLRALVEMAVVAEDVGFDAVMVSEHIVLRDDSPSPLAPAIASLPAQQARGFTTFCIKPSQFVDDIALYPAWCREVVERVGELGT